MYLKYKTQSNINDYLLSRLRISELLNLKLSHVDTQRKTFYIKAGKGRPGFP